MKKFVQVIDEIYRMYGIKRTAQKQCSVTVESSVITKETDV